MSAPPLTVRNLTSTALELKLIERYQAHAAIAQGYFSSFSRNVTSLVSTPLPPGPSATQLAENVKSFDHKDVSIRIEPFTAHQTDVQAYDHASHGTLRLTFECDGQRYRMDTPSRSTDSQILRPLSANPKRQLTGIFLPATSFVAIYSSANLQSWMKELSDDTPLSALSIPGTHNTPTCHKALPSVRCQAVSPALQLENGVRFFDVRVQPEEPLNPANDALILVHGVFPISLTGQKLFRSLLNSIRTFLDANPSETIIMSLKREGPGSATDEQLSLILHDHYTTGDNAARYWHTEPSIPLLGAARGKIVLLRRFALAERLRAEHDGRGWGLDGECWAYNTAHDIHGDVCVQDFCEVLEPQQITEKISACCAHFERAGNAVCPIPGLTTDRTNPVPPGPLYLNFLSASNFWKVGCWPERIAERVNPEMVDFLCRRHDVEGGTTGDGGVGVVVCDWVGKHGDWDLVRCIVGMNARLEVMEKTARA